MYVFICIKIPFDEFTLSMRLWGECILSGGTDIKSGESGHSSASFSTQSFGSTCSCPCTYCRTIRTYFVLWVKLISTIYIFVLIFLIKLAPSIMLTLDNSCRNPCTVCVPSSLAKTDVFSSIILQAMLVVCIHALRLYLWFTLLLLPASFGHWVNTLTRCNNTHYEHCDIANSWLFWSSFHV